MEHQELWDEIKGGPFEAVVRARFGVDETYYVFSDISGGKEVQIGDYTWDTDPIEIEISAIPQKVFKSGNPMLITDTDRTTYRQTFYNLPDLWAWLS